jgi:hypothetical protein
MRGKPTSLSIGLCNRPGIRRRGAAEWNINDCNDGNKQVTRSGRGEVMAVNLPSAKNGEMPPAATIMPLRVSSFSECTDGNWTVK